MPEPTPCQHPMDQLYCTDWYYEPVTQRYYRDWKCKLCGKVVRIEMMKGERDGVKQK